MKKSVQLAIGAVASAFAGSHAFAESATANIGVNITDQPLQIQPDNTGLQFGDVTPDGNTSSVTVSPTGTVTTTGGVTSSGSTSAATFSIQGTPGGTIIIDQIPDTSITSGNSVLPVNNFVIGGNEVTAPSGSTTTYRAVLPSGSVTPITVGVGATLELPSGFPTRGAYTGQFAINVTYQ